MIKTETTILIKTKKDLKTRAQKLASELGFSLTDIVNASLRQFITNQGLTVSKIPTDSLEMYRNKEEILAAYYDSLKNH